jgi:hypothetical protein
VTGRGRSLSIAPLAGASTKKDLRRRLGEGAASDHCDQKQRQREGDEGVKAGGHIGARPYHDGDATCSHRGFALDVASSA